MQVFGPAVRFNVQCTPTRHTYDQFRDNWLLCERLGFDVAYSTDHFVSGQPDNSVLEGPTPYRPNFNEDDPLFSASIMRLSPAFVPGLIVANASHGPPACRRRAH